jgi:hypothetical protein
LFSASIYAYFQLVPHESSLSSRGYEHTHPAL